jgi:signal transduction histidine kinase
MTYPFYTSAFVGILQLAVPTYGLRLNRQFGSRQVGWALVVAFVGLALLNLAGGMGSAGLRREWAVARSLVGAVIPVLLLIGLAHVETLFRERARAEREQTLRHCELEQCLERRTEELAEAKEEFHRELGRRDQQQRELAERAQQEPLRHGAEVAARAGQRLNRHLAVIDLYAKLLLKKQSDPGTAQYHGRLVAEAAAAQALGRQLLACDGCQPLRTQLLSLSDVVRRHLPALRNLLREHRLLEFSWPVQPLLVWADPQLVRWMLEELVRNARDAMSDSGCLRIRVERGDVSQIRRGQAPATNQFACVVVTDTGRGMDREVQQHLGQPFFTTNSGKSSGLGLASVSGLIKAHGGWLEVTSALGQGTEVRLCFPSAEAYPPGTLAPSGLTANQRNRA